MNRRRAALAALPLLLAAASAQAHPHVWVDYELTTLFDHGRITALRQDWSFDEDFTASVLSDVLKRHNGAAMVEGSFTPGETSRLQQTAFANLKNFGYFTHVWLAGKPVALAKEVTGFQARLSDSRLYYTFTLALNTPADPHAGPVSIGIWDDSYYVDVGPAKTAKPRLEGEGAAGCKSVLSEDHDHPIYFGSIFPYTIRITC